MSSKNDKQDNEGEGVGFFVAVIVVVQLAVWFVQGLADFALKVLSMITGSPVPPG